MVSEGSKLTPSEDGFWLSGRSIFSFPADLKLAFRKRRFDPMEGRVAGVAYVIGARVTHDRGLTSASAEEVLP